MIHVFYFTFSRSFYHDSARVQPSHIMFNNVIFIEDNQSRDCEATVDKYHNFSVTCCTILSIGAYGGRVVARRIQGTCKGIGEVYFLCCFAVFHTQTEKRHSVVHPEYPHQQRRPFLLLFKNRFIDWHLPD